MNLNNLLRETVTFQGWCIILLSLLSFLLSLLKSKQMICISSPPPHCLKTPIKEKEREKYSLWRVCNEGVISYIVAWEDGKSTNLYYTHLTKMCSLILA